MTPIDKPDLNALSRDEHIQLAAEQSALHAANLALARWSSGYWPNEVPPASAQSLWHAAAQNNFAVWLAAGGFSQAEAEAAPELAPASAPAGTGRHIYTA
ncbi:hypothetical protein [Janthinobacterium fluminis]|uniref:Uncharacterized protein n=1 Tax=Janthinobacterium fluminis TaxID=2987524 RepID=A0ABT5K4I9_9BURK|nr:hypothetical protein [Janthinobacterium fluminis]MDC8759343.1 hypothetical protein [Janthinobacterium fluminis]